MHCKNCLDRQTVPKRKVYNKKERGKRERKRRNKMSNAFGEGAISTPSPTVGTRYVK
jgi:hypothetical protein